MLTSAQIIFAVLAGGGLALCALLAFRFLGPEPQQKKPQRPPLDHSADAPWAVFTGATCTQASASALEIAGVTDEADLDWSTYRAALAQRFEGLPKTLTDSFSLGAEPAEFSSRMPCDAATLTFEPAPKGLRITVQDARPLSAADRHEAFALTSQLSRIRHAVDLLPHPMWVTSRTNSVLWSNKAFSDLQRNVLNDDTGKEGLFEVDPIKAIGGDTSERLSLTLPAPLETVHWFDVSTVELNEQSFLHCAVNVDGLIAAETAQRKFVQTLAKTFAQLSTGLAIFDRDRRLALFNPALVDLTSLPAHFLSGQPNLQNFFDRLRDNRIMPEPKDYSSWRRQIADLVVQSEGGRYQEVWRLPSGLTYRIVGRPHPDGAIAILIEDISVEMSLTQRFKGQIEMGRSALNMQRDGFIAFEADGSITSWNDAFLNFIGLPNDTPPRDYNISSVLRLLRDRLAPGTVRNTLSGRLRDARDTIGTFELSDGQELPYEVRAHDGNATLMSLHLSALDDTPPTALRKAASKEAIAG